MLRIDDDAVDVLDGTPLPSLGRTEHNAFHAFHEYATVARIPDRGNHLDPRYTPVRPNPEQDLVLSLFFGRRPLGDVGYQLRRGPEDITRGAARARAGIVSYAGPRTG